MKNYESIILFGIIIFPLIAFIITIPYMVKQYHRYGSIPFFRTLIIYSFVLYLLIIYFLVILPLPSIESVENMTSKWMQLIPFTFVKDIVMNAKIELTNPSTYINFLKNPTVYVVLFNIIMTLPFGIYLRYYFKRKWWEVLILSILLCGFFELTQLSGLYGIYPRPYRLFDVDDFIQNVSGAMIGYSITPLLFFLPSRRKIDEKAYKRGKRVSFIRRVTSLLIDLTIINSILLIIVGVFNMNMDIELHTLIIMFSFMFTTIICNGETIGKKCVKIKLTNINGEKAKFYQIMYRYIIMYFIIIFLPKVIIELPNNNISLITQLVLITIYIFLNLRIIIDIFKKKEQMIYDKLTKTKYISTVPIKQKEEHE